MCRFLKCNGFYLRSQRRQPLPWSPTPLGRLLGIGWQVPRVGSGRVENGSSPLTAFITCGHHQ
jgi:hypothetical protein